MRIWGWQDGSSKTSPIPSTTLHPMKTLLLIAVSVSLSSLTSCTTVVAPETPAPVVTETQVRRTSTSSTYGTMPTSTTTETHSVTTE